MGGKLFVPSANVYDWLGKGTYFWEDDVLRAYEWATWRRPKTPCVVGAVIDLGHCLDLTNQSGLRAVEVAFNSLAALSRQRNESLPKNEDAPSGTKGDLALRRLDRAVIDHLNFLQDLAADKNKVSSRFQTIRALFPEGEKLYPGAGFRSKTHVQLCVRDQTRILGVFRIPTHQRLKFDLPDFYKTVEDR